MVFVQYKEDRWKRSLAD